jgi:hypothetical protein
VVRGVGLERGGKKKTLDHRLREDGYVEVQATPTAEHPICEFSCGRGSSWRFLDTVG